MFRRDNVAGLSHKAEEFGDQWRVTGRSVQALKARAREEVLPTFGGALTRCAIRPREGARGGGDQVRPKAEEERDPESERVERETGLRRAGKEG